MDWSRRPIDDAQIDAIDFDDDERMEAVIAMTDEELFEAMRAAEAMEQEESYEEYLSAIATEDDFYCTALADFDENGEPEMTLIVERDGKTQDYDIPLSEEQKAALTEKMNEARSVEFDKDMLEGSIEEGFTIKEDFIGEIIDKLLSRFDIPTVRIVLEIEPQQIAVDMDENNQPSVSVVTAENSYPVPLFENEKESLAESVCEYTAEQEQTRELE